MAQYGDMAYHQQGYPQQHSDMPGPGAKLAMKQPVGMGAAGPDEWSIPAGQGSWDAPSSPAGRQMNLPPPPPPQAQYSEGQLNGGMGGGHGYQQMSGSVPGYHSGMGQYDGYEGQYQQQDGGYQQGGGYQQQGSGYQDQYQQGGGYQQAGQYQQQGAGYQQGGQYQQQQQQPGHGDLTLEQKETLLMQKAQQMMMQLQMSGQLPSALAQQLLAQQQAAAAQSPQSPSYQQGAYQQEYGSPRSAPAVSTTGEMSLAPATSSSQGQGQAAGGRPSMPEAPVSSAFRMSTTEVLPLQMPGASSSWAQVSRCGRRLQRCQPLLLPPPRAEGLPAAASDLSLRGRAMLSSAALLLPWLQDNAAQDYNPTPNGNDFGYQSRGTQEQPAAPRSPTAARTAQQPQQQAQQQPSSQQQQPSSPQGKVPTQSPRGASTSPFAAALAASNQPSSPSAAAAPSSPSKSSSSRERESSSRDRDREPSSRDRESRERESSSR
jgi:hypothetical protein